MAKIQQLNGYSDGCKHSGRHWAQWCLELEQLVKFRETVTDGIKVKNVLDGLIVRNNVEVGREGPPLRRDPGSGEHRDDLPPLLVQGHRKLSDDFGEDGIGLDAASQGVNDSDVARRRRGFRPVDEDLSSQT